MESYSLSHIGRSYKPTTSCKMGTIHLFTWKMVDIQVFVGLQLSSSSFPKFHFRDIYNLYWSSCTAMWHWQKVMECKMEELQPCRQPTVQEFVGLQVSNSSFTRFLIHVLKESKNLSAFQNSGVSAFQGL